MILSRSAHALFSCAIFVMAPDVCTSPSGSQRSRPEGNEDDFDPATSSKKSGKTRPNQADPAIPIPVSTWLLIGYFIAIPCKR
jgi:hypothetical protein